jgi:signal transduction histidine kinase
MNNNNRKGLKVFFYEFGRKDPLSNLSWWILLRWLFLGVVILVTLLGNKLLYLNIATTQIFLLCGIILCMNAWLNYRLFLLKKAPSLDMRLVDKMTYTQFTGDWTFITFLFYYTGGIASPFLFYFLFHVVLSGVLLEKWACFLYATLNAVTITTLSIMELSGFLPHIYSSIISQEVQNNPFFVMMLLFFFLIVLYISFSFVSILLKRLRERIRLLMELQYKVEQSNQMLELLNEVAKNTASTLGLKPRLDYICSSIRELMGVKGVAIRLLDKSTNRLELMSACGLSESYINKGPVHADKSLAQALRGEPHFVLEAPTDPSIQYPEEARQEGIVSMLSFPLEGREEVIGTLRLYTSEKRRFSQEEIDFLSALASQGAISLENARIYDTLNRQDQAKNDFIILMTHELKGPLMAIQGLLEVVLKGYAGTLTQKQQELVERMYKRIESLLEVSSGLLDIYQWESRRLDVRRAPISINDQVKRALELYKGIAQEKGLTIDIELPDDDFTLMGTEEEIEKIFNNLVTNAIKYTPSGGRISMGISPSEGHVVFWVKDTGIGISSEDLTKIFGEFFRTKEAKRIDPNGRGLGLPFVKRIVESLGGTIKVKSERGKGTEFVLTFPRV